MIYPVSCTTVCSYVKSRGGPSKFSGVRTPNPPVVAPLVEGLAVGSGDIDSEAALAGRCRCPGRAQHIGLNSV